MGKEGFFAKRHGDLGPDGADEAGLDAACARMPAIIASASGSPARARP